MNKRIHFPLTTAQQRRLLFETWEATGDVEEACRTAHVGRRTFYTWKPRFLKGGYGALEQFPSRAPKRTRRTPDTIAEQVIALRQQHPDDCPHQGIAIPGLSPNEFADRIWLF